MYVCIYHIGINVKFRYGSPMYDSISIHTSFIYSKVSNSLFLLISILLVEVSQKYPSFQLAPRFIRDSNIYIIIYNICISTGSSVENSYLDLIRILIFNSEMEAIGGREIHTCIKHVCTYICLYYVYMCICMTGTEMGMI
jgi:hypothetical protein